MIDNIKKLREIFNLSGVNNFYILFLIFFKFVFELISIGMLIPYLTLILDPSTYEKYYSLAKSLNLSAFKKLFIRKKDFLFIFTVLIFLMFIIKFL